MKSEDLLLLWLQADKRLNKRLASQSSVPAFESVNSLSSSSVAAPISDDIPLSNMKVR